MSYSSDPNMLAAMKWGVRAGLRTVLLLALVATFFPASPAFATDRTYEPATGEIVNPERGLYTSIDLTTETDLTWVRDEGFTLAHAYVRLDDYRNTTIPQSFLDDVKRGLDAARAAGIKVIFRASYNFGIGEDDAPMSRVLEHIGQFQPIWEEHADVIVVVQAGFIGAWGEWHSSTNGLDTPAAKAQIRDALLAAVPDSRMIQFRYLPDIETWSPTPLSSSNAYDGSDTSRTAHHNDCFLATDDDAGTYWPGDIGDHKDYLAAASEHFVVGGETCQVGFAANQARRACSVATAELARFHWSYLNSEWHQPTLQIWKDQGCFDEIGAGLGYRYRLVSSSLPAQIVAGSTLTGSIDIANGGYATVFNERPVYLVLDGPERVELELDTDPRGWSAGSTETVSLNAPVPASLAPGDYTMALWLPDASETIRNRPDYAIRFANENVWNATGGYNVLGDLTVLPATRCSGVVGSRYSDVGAGNVFCGDVEWLAESGITLGCNPPANDRFCPADGVTRGQMAAFLYRALYGTLTEGPAPAFTDSAGLFETEITWLGASGVTRGCNPPINDQFCPDNLVTRGQMAAFLVRALGLPVAITDTFVDDDTSEFEADIESLAAAGITRGCNPPVNDQFCPTSQVTREQMAAFLHRALGTG